MNATAMKFWNGDPPARCDVDQKPITTVFVDAATRQGWGILCPGCHKTHGCGLGTGKGQEYTKQPDGRWRKTGG
jgi:hypothetical protein